MSSQKLLQIDECLICYSANINPHQNIVFFYLRETAKKAYFLNGSVIKRGVGKGLAIKKKNSF